MSDIVFSIIGPIGIVYGVYKLIAAINSTKWKMCTGTIANKKLKSHIDSGAREYNLSISYWYEIGKKIYTSNAISPGIRFKFNTSNYSTDRSLSQHYYEGQKIPVYFNPKRPGQSCLRPGDGLVGSIIFICIFICVAFTGISNLI